MRSHAGLNIRMMPCASIRITPSTAVSTTARKRDCSFCACIASAGRDAEHLLQGGGKLTGAERLDQSCVGAEVAGDGGRVAPVGHAGAGDRDDGQRWVGSADFLDELIATGAGHVHVGDHGVECFAADYVKAGG